MKELSVHGKDSLGEFRLLDLSILSTHKLETSHCGKWSIILGFTLCKRKQ